jgi:hypothetical protein
MGWKYKKSVLYAGLFNKQSKDIMMIMSKDWIPDEKMTHSVLPLSVKQIMSLQSRVN